MRIFARTLLVILTLAISASAQSRTERTEKEIGAAMQQLADAALKSDPSVAERMYDPTIIVTSQSGKVYSKSDSLLDLKNPFELYKNDEIKFLHLDDDAVVVSYRNTRKRKTLDEASFRVTAVWMKHKGSWKLYSIQSTKIVTQGM